MTSSTELPLAVWQRLRAGLSVERRQQAIGARLASALGSWPAVGDAPLTTAEFHWTIATFVQHLYEHGLQPARQLSAEAALAVALGLIEVGYPTEGALRYAAAHFDACDPEGAGVARVLQFLLEALQGEAHYKALVWAVASVVGGADWGTRCALVATLRSSAPHLLAGRLGTLTTAELAAVVVVLMGADAELSLQDRHALGWLSF